MDRAASPPGVARPAQLVEAGASWNWGLVTAVGACVVFWVALVFGVLALA